ncbi:MAG: RnfABCDGE type electron transport complex subunit G [Bacteroidaceae bacterium]|nr:RnfABCDGE type electron transport complex subunit G [Bacteroidaceae bacterium]
MKKLESNFLNMAVVLLVIAAVAAALLASVNSMTVEPIAKINEDIQNNAIRSVLVGDSDVELSVAAPVQKGELILFKANDAAGNLVGTAVRSVDHNGFGGDLVVMVGFAPDGTILGYEVLEHAETPGLGAQAKDWFKQSAAASDKGQSKLADIMLGAASAAGNHNIVGMNPGKSNMTVSKDGGDVDAITASTITSRAFLRTVQAAYNAIK